MTTPRRRSELSRLSIVALGLNIPFFLPPFTLLAAVLGAVASIRISRRRDLRGQPFAIAAIVIGLSLSSLFLGYYWWGFARITNHGAPDAIRAAERGDGDSIRGIFVGDPRGLADEEVALFAETLRARYGALVDGRIRRTTADPPRTGQTWSVPFDLTFERGPREALVGITVVDPRSAGSTLALAWIRVLDPERGDVIFPRESRSLAVP